MACTISEVAEVALPRATKRSCLDGVVDGRKSAEYVATLVEEALCGSYGALEKLKEAFALSAPANVGLGACTPLMRAVQAPHPGLVRLLLEGRASPDLADPKGVRPLHIASFDGYDEVVQLLVDASANVDARDRYLQTPLFFAANARICEILASAKADVNARNVIGQSALHLASHSGLENTVRWMVLNAAPGEIDRPDSNGRTPLRLALRRGLHSMASFLEELGATSSREVSSKLRATGTFSNSQRGLVGVVRLRPVGADAGANLGGIDAAVPIDNASKRKNSKRRRHRTKQDDIVEQKLTKHIPDESSVAVRVHISLNDNAFISLLTPKATSQGRGHELVRRLELEEVASILSRELAIEEVLQVAEESTSKGESELRYTSQEKAPLDNTCKQNSEDIVFKADASTALIIDGAPTGTILREPELIANAVFAAGVSCQESARSSLLRSCVGEAPPVLVACSVDEQDSGVEPRPIETPTTICDSGAENNKRIEVMQLKMQALRARSEKPTVAGVMKSKPLSRKRASKIDALRSRVVGAIIAGSVDGRLEEVLKAMAGEKEAAAKIKGRESSAASDAPAIEQLKAVDILCTGTLVADPVSSVQKAPEDFEDLMSIAETESATEVDAIQAVPHKQPSPPQGYLEAIVGEGREVVIERAATEGDPASLFVLEEGSRGMDEHESAKLTPAGAADSSSAQELFAFKNASDNSELFSDHAKEWISVDEHQAASENSTPESDVEADPMEMEDNDKARDGTVPSLNKMMSRPPAFTRMDQWQFDGSMETWMDRCMYGWVRAAADQVVAATESLADNREASDVTIVDRASASSVGHLAAEATAASAADTSEENDMTLALAFSGGFLSEETTGAAVANKAEVSDLTVVDEVLADAAEVEIAAANVSEARYMKCDNEAAVSSLGPIAAMATGAAAAADRREESGITLIDEARASSGGLIVKEATVVGVADNPKVNDVTILDEGPTSSAGPTASEAASAAEANDCLESGMTLVDASLPFSGGLFGEKATGGAVPDTQAASDMTFVDAVVVKAAEVAASNIRAASRMTVVDEDSTSSCGTIAAVAAAVAVADEREETDVTFVDEASASSGGLIAEETPVAAVADNPKMSDMIFADASKVTAAAIVDNLGQIKVTFVEAALSLSGGLIAQEAKGAAVDDNPESRDITFVDEVVVEAAETAAAAIREASNMTFFDEASASSDGPFAAEVTTASAADARDDRDVRCVDEVPGLIGGPIAEEITRAEVADNPEASDMAFFDDVPASNDKFSLLEVAAAAFANNRVETAMTFIDEALSVSGGLIAEEAIGAAVADNHEASDMTFVDEVVVKAAEAAAAAMRDASDITFFDEGSASSDGPIAAEVAAAAGVDACEESDMTFADETPASSDGLNAKEATGAAVADNPEATHLTFVGETTTSSAGPIAFEVTPAEASDNHRDCDMTFADVSSSLGSRLVAQKATGAAAAGDPKASDITFVDEPIVQVAEAAAAAIREASNMRFADEPASIGPGAPEATASAAVDAHEVNDMTFFDVGSAFNGGLIAEEATGTAGADNPKASDMIFLDEASASYVGPIVVQTAEAAAADIPKVSSMTFVDQASASSGGYIALEATAAGAADDREASFITIVDEAAAFGGGLTVEGGTGAAVLDKPEASDMTFVNDALVSSAGPFEVGGAAPAGADIREASDTRFAAEGAASGLEPIPSEAAEAVADIRKASNRTVIDEVSASCGEPIAAEAAAATSADIHEVVDEDSASSVGPISAEAAAVAAAAAVADLREASERSFSEEASASSYEPIVAEAAAIAVANIEEGSDLTFVDEASTLTGGAVAAETAAAAAVPWNQILLAGDLFHPLGVPYTFEHKGPPESEKIHSISENTIQAKGLSTFEKDANENLAEAAAFEQVSRATESSANVDGKQGELTALDEARVDSTTTDAAPEVGAQLADAVAPQNSAPKPKTSEDRLSADGAASDRDERVGDQPSSYNATPNAQVATASAERSRLVCGEESEAKEAPAAEIKSPETEMTEDEPYVEEVQPVAKRAAPPEASAADSAFMENSRASEDISSFNDMPTVLEKVSTDGEHLRAEEPPAALDGGCDGDLSHPLGECSERQTSSVKKQDAPLESELAIEGAKHLPACAKDAVPESQPNAATTEEMHSVDEAKDPPCSAANVAVPRGKPSGVGVEDFSVFNDDPIDPSMEPAVNECPVDDADCIESRTNDTTGVDELPGTATNTSTRVEVLPVNEIEGLNEAVRPAETSPSAESIAADVKEAPALGEDLTANVKELEVTRNIRKEETAKKVGDLLARLAALRNQFQNSKASGTSSEPIARKISKRRAAKWAQRENEQRYSSRESTQPAHGKDASNLAHRDNEQIDCSLSMTKSEPALDMEPVSADPMSPPMLSTRDENEAKHPAVVAEQAAEGGFTEEHLFDRTRDVVPVTDVESQPYVEACTRELIEASLADLLTQDMTALSGKSNAGESNEASALGARPTLPGEEAPSSTEEAALNCEAHAGQIHECLEQEARPGHVVAPINSQGENLNLEPANELREQDAESTPAFEEEAEDLFIRGESASNVEKLTSENHEAHALQALPMAEEGPTTTKAESPRNDMERANLESAKELHEHEPEVVHSIHKKAGDLFIDMKSASNVAAQGGETDKATASEAAPLALAAVEVATTTEALPGHRMEVLNVEQAMEVQEIVSKDAPFLNKEPDDLLADAKSPLSVDAQAGETKEACALGPPDSLEAPSGVAQSPERRPPGDRFGIPLEPPQPLSDEVECKAWNVHVGKNGGVGKYGFAHVNYKVLFLTCLHPRVSSDVIGSWGVAPEMLLVKRITGGLLLDLWNQENPGLDVQVGDLICEVNGQRSVDAMQEALRCDSIILRVLRYPKRFHIELARDPEVHKLGLRFTKDAELRVTELYKDGLLGRYNDERLAERLFHLVVLPGMVIEAVNEDDNQDRIARKLKEDARLKIRFRRADLDLLAVPKQPTGSGDEKVSASSSTSQPKDLSGNRTRSKRPRSGSLARQHSHKQVLLLSASTNTLSGS